MRQLGRLFGGLVLLLVYPWPAGNESVAVDQLHVYAQLGDSVFDPQEKSSQEAPTTRRTYTLGIPGTVADKGPVPQPRPVKKITLTFDDCGYPPVGTVRILDVLAAYKVRAIFFTTGACVELYPAVFDRVIAEGHLIGNHTYNHSLLTSLTLDQVRWQIDNGPPQARGAYWRPPYGAHNPTIDSIAAELGYTLVLWTIDTYDWKGRSAREILNTILANARPGAIVLMHVHGQHTPEALPAIIENLRAMGYYVGYQPE